MNTKSFSNISEIKEKFKSLFDEKDEKEGIEHDAYMLMSGYLSEIERIQGTSTLYNNRKKLAEAIKTSGSYLTQVFRGDKPLNFFTLAKIQRILKVTFNVTAHLQDGTGYSTKITNIGSPVGIGAWERAANDPNKMYFILGEKYYNAKIKEIV